MTMVAAPAKKINRLGLEKTDYRGLESTLCSGCGHDSIAAHITTACFELGLKPEQVAKFSGIGCSSKSPAYFMSRSWAFNGLHGRMPSIATGALMANHRLVGLGLSGDGDSGSIGMGQFKHILRRNVRMVYIVENNGVYSLTKGQFSATADIGQKVKYGGENKFLPIDLCMEAIAAGCGFVARSFAGDPKQVLALIKAAFGHRGTALLDIISPCITFNNQEESTKSYGWGKTHEERINDFNFIAPQDEIVVDYAPGEAKEVTMHDGSKMVLRKLDKSNHDPSDKIGALRLLEDARAKQIFITGLIYVDNSRPSLAELAGLGETPLVHIPAAQLRPPRESLDKIMAGLA